MPITVKETDLPGVLIIHPEVRTDERGYFLETYNQKKYSDIGLDVAFVQDNHSHSIRNVVRGLHYQLRYPQGKLIYVLSGEILDVAVDIRAGSPTFGKWTGVMLSSQNRRQLYIPPGFAHGFAVLSDEADMIYKCTDLYSAQDDFGVLWNDPDLKIEWSIAVPILSEKDKNLSPLKKIPTHQLPSFENLSSK